MYKKNRQRPNAITTNVPKEVRELLEIYAALGNWSLSQATARVLVSNIEHIKQSINEMKVRKSDPVINAGQ